MKRTIFSVILALILVMNLAVCAAAATDTGLLYDEADLLTSAEETELLTKLQSVGAEHQAQLIVVTLPSMNGGDIDQFVEYIYDSMNFGIGENRDGVLLLVSMDPRQYRILSNGYAGSAIDVGTIDRIGEAIVPDLSAGYYADAFAAFAEQCDYYLDGYQNGYPFNFGQKLMVALVIGLVAGLIVALVLKGQLKTVYKQNQARSYVKPGTMQLTTNSDIFLYHDVKRTPRPKSNSSGSRSSSSSRSVGGGSF